MTQDYFRIERGLQLDDTVTYLTGNGTPGSSFDSGVVDVGSVYTNSADGSIWTKIASGTGISKWQKLASETYVNNALGATVSWREPALANDISSTTLPSGTAGNPVVVDGVSVTDGGRVLFSAIVGGVGPNVYVYNQTTGGFVADANVQSGGDAVYVQQGSEAGKTFIYNGSAWVQSDQSSLDEEGYIRSFIGKTVSGSSLPTYSSNNFVANSDNLKVAISKLDAEIGANVALGNWINPANKVNDNITRLDTKLGADFGATNHLTSLVAGNTVTGNLAIVDGLLGPSLIAGSIITVGQAAFPAIQALDIAIGPNVTNGNYVLSTNKIQQNIQTLDTTIGANVTNGGYVAAANSVQQNIQALDSAIVETNKLTTVNNVTAATLIDSIPAASLDVAKFFVFVEDAADSANRYATEIYVLCDGTTVDYNKYGTLKLGLAITGLQVSAVLSGGNVSIQVSSTAAVNVKVRRATVIQ